MRISVERLRVGLLVGAGLLVVAIAAFLGYARYRLHRGLVNLPGKLGATITSESNGITWSQSDGKQTVFTIHAAKSVQHSDGKYTLRDVNIILYGHKGDRADRISGSEFEYDTRAEVIHAIGLVHIDLQAPVAQGTRESEASKHLDATGFPTGVGEEAGAGSRVIHVTTSGLTFEKKLATAATDQELEFAFGGFTGHAVGAEYNSDSGHLVLQSAVTVSGLAGHPDGDKPIALAASHGELDRESNQADFDQARYSSAGEVAQAEVAHLHLRQDGSLERIEGVGHVVLENAGQGTATADRADVSLDPANKPKTAVLTGKVKFNEDEAFHETRGDSERADLDFDGHGRIERAVLRGDVHTYERILAAENTNAPWSERTLTANSVDLALVAAGESGKAELREATATGSARLNSVSTVDDGTAGTKASRTTTRFAADELQAHFIDARGAAELSTVHGTGHTVLEQVAPGDVTQTSSSETLDARFREASGAKGSVEVAEAVQQGGVAIDRRAPAKVVAKKTGDSPALGEVLVTQHAIAQRASYDADTDRLTLTDGVRMSDPQRTIWAAKVVMDRDSGDATADGGVKVTYLQEGQAQPVHVLAERAELNHDAGRATFYGRAAAGSASGSGLARMWQAGPAAQTVTGQAEARRGGLGQGGSQGGSQIEAPVLIFEQETKRLTARAERSGVAGTVHTVLTSASSQTRYRGDSGSGTKPDAKPVAGKAKPLLTTGAKKAARAGSNGMGSDGTRESEIRPPMRITSSELVYSDEQRQAVFTGGVRVVDSAGEMRAQEATVFLTRAQAKAEKDAGAIAPKAQGDGLLGGQVERILATRRVEITQPGRVATGDKLVYTVSDQMYVLTGTVSVPPKVVDDGEGMTTGAMLRFHSEDGSVSVLGSDGEVPARRVHTETHTQPHTHTETRMKQP